MSAQLKALKTKKTQEIPFQDASVDIWDKKYRLKTKDGEDVDNNMDETYQRVAQAIAEVEDEDKRLEWYENFYGLYVMVRFLRDALFQMPVR